nr:uncharacterized protein LOC121115588 [Lepeophtheirus salmonis]
MVVENAPVKSEGDQFFVSMFQQSTDCPILSEADSEDNIEFYQDFNDIIYPQIINCKIEEDINNDENTIEQPSNDLYLPKICEDEGFIYVAGYVAKSLHPKFPLWAVILPASKFLQVHGLKQCQEGDCFNHRNHFWNFAKKYRIISLSFKRIFLIPNHM